MAINGLKIGIGSSSDYCPDAFGCGGLCPNFIIKRHDTKPVFKAAIEDCDGALDLTEEENLVLEVNMWANAKLKSNITDTDEYFALADNIGFEQIMVGDIIVMERVRLPEHMLVIGFDETNKFVRVQRAYHGTPASSWKKGSKLKIFRILNGPAEIESVFQDIMQEDGSVATDQLTETLFVYDWQEADTCLPGCYWLEFKLLKMTESVSLLSTSDDDMSVVPSFTPSEYTAEDFGCSLGDGIEWVRRFPSNSDGFLIQIINNSTADI